MGSKGKRAGFSLFFFSLFFCMCLVVRRSKGKKALLLQLEIDYRQQKENISTVCDIQIYSKREKEVFKNKRRNRGELHARSRSKLKGIGLFFNIFAGVERRRRRRRRKLHNLYRVLFADGASSWTLVAIDPSSIHPPRCCVMLPLSRQAVHTHQSNTFLIKKYCN